MAAAGYGKRSAPDQAPRTRADFTHLPPREAEIATYIDRLPEGAAMDVKTLAKQLPGYGQQAVGTALRRLSEAGHLRRNRELADGDGTRWVTRTHFTRTARDDAWWTTYLNGDVPPDHDEEQQPPAERNAYEALASVGRADPRMTLSAAECAELVPLTDEWLARGATAGDIIRALTTGLPEPVHSPVALARRRLRDKLPPERVQRTRTVPRPIAVLECTSCGKPEFPKDLLGGICPACRTTPPEPDRTEVPVEHTDFIENLKAEIREVRTQRPFR
ncbi:hypothetical protein I5Q34_11540 [Streptomyces sp. AV19]|uniref:MarR family transcriptional regulator n=1 Tax=Streptomyces sp. AV19 TaxID=2793068 RepID=UPI0018FE494C|nr:helix-turn-helix domain-containing protein [Streptomyces sp. AV19]MBH1934899.1 hypothetical protein [Streptomyces sp. AV19]MDG4537033.1 MarR family transcriptional regulator [Streptomyces sp. AV19]